MPGGWFPRFSPDGSKVTSERPGFWQAQWLDNNTEIGHNGTSLVINGAVTVHPSLNLLAAGAGKWAGDKGGPGVHRNFGESFIPGAGDAAISPGGRFAYKVDRQSENTGLFLEGVGVVHTGDIASVRISDSLLVWNAGSTSLGYTDKVLDLGIPGIPTFRPIPIDTPQLLPG
jgi:hypothetical protein